MKFSMRKGNRFSLKTTIPANTTATVFVPAKSADSVTEHGQPAAQSAGVQLLRMERDAAVFAVVSEEYTFASE